MKNLTLLVKELIKLDAEYPCVEFKQNNSDPQMIGEYISALSNTAAIEDKSKAYVLWGIDNDTHEIVGTEFNYRTKKGEGNEDLEPWLRRLLSDNANFEFEEVKIDNKNVVILIIYKAIGKTVFFKNVEYIRVGSHKKKLKDNPGSEAKLWQKINNSRFEELPAEEDMSLQDVLNELDYVTYFDMSGIAVPAEGNQIAHYLLEDKIILYQDNGLYTISNLGALLFAKKLDKYPALDRKRIRVIQYEDDKRINILRQDTGGKGYASGFEGLVKYIAGLLPAKDEIEAPLRKEKTVYPIVAIRELIANALIHQDLSITGAGPTIEIFKSRIEITNPGTPLVNINRIIDNPPRSRNEIMASLMRRLGICEELGTGWDRVATYCETYLLPAPQIDIYEENTKVTVFGPIAYKNMTQETRLWTCYLHACLKYVNQEKATNSTLRDRLGLASTAAASASRLINLAVEAELIKPLDPNTAPRYMSYIPFWA
nr:ATP-binding protein [uncultured Mogibacterium sp.]